MGSAARSSCPTKGSNFSSGGEAGYTAVLYCFLFYPRVLTLFPLFFCQPLYVSCLTYSMTDIEAKKERQADFTPVVPFTLCPVSRLLLNILVTQESIGPSFSM